LSYGPNLLMLSVASPVHTLRASKQLAVVRCGLDEDFEVAVITRRQLDCAAPKTWMHLGCGILA